MKSTPNQHHRRSIRLKNYDYSQSGAYFVTICTHNRECLFGGVINGKMALNEYAEIVRRCWLEIPQHFPHALLDEFVVMPNHVHGIFIINNVGVQNFEPLQNQYQKIIPKSIGSIVRGFKIGVTKWFRQNTYIHIVWQRNYYEHIIRNEIELNKIREYIINNPLQWESDKYFNL